MTKQRTELPKQNIAIESIDTDSFIHAISHITKIAESEFLFDVKHKDHESWYDPYLLKLQEHGYDMIFYSYRDTPIILDDERKLEDYSFPQMPRGKCIIICVDGSFECHSIVAKACIVNEDNPNIKQLIITYDPTPERPKKWVLEVGFFIDMFDVSVLR